MRKSFFLILLTIAGHLTASRGYAANPLRVDNGASVVLIGNGLGSRMGRFGYFETELQRRHADAKLVIRNLCDEGDTAGFRPHSARNTPWAFPGAEKYRTLGTAKDRWGSGNTGSGSFPTPDEWLTRLKADAIICFFGYNESFAGPAGLDAFKAELTEFIVYSKKQQYNGHSAPQLALVSPTAFQNLSASQGTPDGTTENANLAIYTAAMQEIADAQQIRFVDLFSVTTAWFADPAHPMTIDGALLTEGAYAKLAPVLADSLFGAGKATADADKILTAVREKNWMWLKYYKIPNGVHVYGRRHGPFGPQNYPHELQKLAEMVAIRDQAIWAALTGNPFDLAAADAKTHAVPETTTNYSVSKKNGDPTYKADAEATAALTVPEGYKVELFASEQQFPHLANPVQMSFDNRGRLWVATMPAYPHYKPGDPKPTDKLLILEDTDGDGKADKETVFADHLHLPIGFEFEADGVYVSQGNDLIRLQDTDGDDHADRSDIMLSGFDDHDTHHAISAFCADPSGAIFMGEGTFLHSNVETAYGPIRSSNGGFFRYSPQRHQLERTARLSIPNPWGIAFDDWGQCFFLDTSDPNMRWMLPGSVDVGYGEFTPNPANLIENKQMVRPTSGLEFISSRHFPDEVQGDILLNNTIGFLGTKQHAMVDSGTGYTTRFRQDLLKASDGNFRPVDMEFAPDGSLYLLDWHNVLIGHMQHSARDPLRDHTHGRVYRITYPARPLVQPAAIAGAPLPVLLDNLKLPEYRSRYRTRRELRGRNAVEVLPAIAKWTAALDKADPRYEHHLLEALWVTWGLNQVDIPLLRHLLVANDFRVRAAAVHILRYAGHQVPEQAELLRRSAGDANGRVKLEAVTAASWLAKGPGLAVLAAAGGQELEKDPFIKDAYLTSLAHLNNETIREAAKAKVTTTLTGEAGKLFLLGAEVYEREGHCGTCHQTNGLGLPAAQFPPLAGSEWVKGSDERLIKIALNGIMGPITVKGVAYPGLVPMTQFKGLSDEEIAGVLTYARNAFGNTAPAISPATVAKVRDATKTKIDFYSPAELLKDHPLEP